MHSLAKSKFGAYTCVYMCVLVGMVCRAYAMSYRDTVPWLCRTKSIRGDQQVTRLLLCVISVLSGYIKWELACWCAIQGNLEILVASTRWNSCFILFFILFLYIKSKAWYYGHLVCRDAGLHFLFYLMVQSGWSSFSHHTHILADRKEERRKVHSLYGCLLEFIESTSV